MKILYILHYIGLDFSIQVNILSQMYTKRAVVTLIDKLNLSVHKHFLFNHSLIFIFYLTVRENQIYLVSNGFRMKYHIKIQRFLSFFKSFLVSALPHQYFIESHTYILLVFPCRIWEINLYTCNRN